MKRLLSTSSTGRIFFALLFIANFAALQPLRAATVFWSPPTTISGDTDVLNLGTTLYAYDWSGSNVTVNGVSFKGSTTFNGSTNVIVSFLSLSSNAFTATVAPFSTLSSSYSNLLIGADFGNGSGTSSIVISNLTVGHRYLAQFWAVDPRGGPEATRAETLTDTGGNTVTLTYDVSQLTGGLGQFSTGVFTANSNNQPFVVQATGVGGSSQMNAIQVRDVTAVTGLNNWGGFAGAAWDFTTANWGARQTFTSVTNNFTSVTFADTDAFGNTITINDVTDNSTGVNPGTVNFVNNLVNYTLGGSSAAGITGATSVNIAGAGSVTFTGLNSYTGPTTVSNGTLFLAGSAQLADTSAFNFDGGIFDVTILGSYTFGNGGPPVNMNGGAVRADSLTLNHATFINQTYSSNAPWIAAKALTVGATASTITINALPGIFPPFHAPLITYTSLSGPPANFVLTLPSGYSGFISNDTGNQSLDLDITNAILPVTWAGNVAGGVWDNVTTNWVFTSQTSAPATYSDGDAVTFDDTASGTTNVVLNSVVTPASVTFSTSALDYTLSGPGQIIGPTALTKNGTALLTLDNINGYTGATAINAGTVAFINNSLGVSGLIAMKTSTLRWLPGTTQDLSSRISISTGSAATLDVGVNTVDFAGSVNGGGSVVKAGAGSLLFDGASAYGGGTVISNGTVQLDGNGRPGLGTITDDSILVLNIQASTLNNAVSGTGTINALISANANSTLAGNFNGFTGVINVGVSPGTGKLVVSTPIGLNVAASINITNGGTFFTSGPLVFVAGPVNVEGFGNGEGYGALRVDGGSTVSGPVTLLSNASIGEAFGGTGTISGPIGDLGRTNSLALTDPNGGTLYLTGTNTYLGATVISNGTLVLTNNGSILPSATIIIFTNGAFVTASNFTMAASQPFIFNGGTMTNQSTLTLNGAALVCNFDSGATPLIAATNLAFGASPSSIQFLSLPLFGSYPQQFPVITYHSSGAPNLQLTLPAGYTGSLANNSGNHSIDLLVTGNGGIFSLTWAGTNGPGWDFVTTNWTGGSTPELFVDNDPVTFNDTAAGSNVNILATVLPASVTVSNNALAYSFNSSGQISGTGPLTKYGTNTLTINNTNSYTGGSYFYNGLVAFISNGLSSSGSLTFNGGGVEWLTGNSQDISSRILIPTGQYATFDVPDANNSVTFHSAIGQFDSGGMTKTGAGMLTLTVAGFNANNPVSPEPTITIQSGTLQQTIRAAPGYGTIDIKEGATLLVDIGSDIVVNAISGQGTMTFVEGNGANTILGGNVTGFTGTVNLTATGSGKTQFSLSNGDFDPAATINVESGATLFLDRYTLDCKISAIGNGNTEGYGALRIDDGALATGPITMLGNTTFGEASGGTGTVSGAIGESGGHFSMILTDPDGGTLTLAGANTYTGSTIISNGVLAMAASGSIATSTNISICGPAAGFDVTAMTGGFSLGANQTLKAVGTGGAVLGNFKMNAGSLALDYSSGHPSLVISNGVFTMNANPVTINVLVNRLAVGSYLVISNTTGSIAGMVSSSPVTVTGAGIASGNVGLLKITPAGLTLTVGPGAPVLNSISLVNSNTVQISFSGPATTDYTVLSSTNLQTPLAKWTPNSTGTFGAVPVNFLDTTSNSARFYTIRSP